MIRDVPGNSRSTLRWVRSGDEIRLAGEVDLTNAGVLSELAAAELARRPADVRFDLQELSFMDGTGVRALLGVARDLHDAGHLLVLVSPGYIVRKALSVLTPEELLGAIRIVDP